MSKKLSLAEKRKMFRHAKSHEVEFKPGATQPSVANLGSIKDMIKEQPDDEAMRSSKGKST